MSRTPLTQARGVGDLDDALLRLALAHIQAVCGGVCQDVATHGLVVRG